MNEQIDKNLLAVCGVGFAGVILLLDIMTPLGVVVPILYLLLLPILGMFHISRGALWFTAATAVLSLVGGYLSPPSVPTPDAMLHESFVNRGLLVLTTLAASYFFFRQVALERVLRRWEVHDRLTGLTAKAPFLDELDRSVRANPSAPLVTIALRLADREVLEASLGVPAADAAMVAIANACRSGLAAPWVAGLYDASTVVAASFAVPFDAARALAGRLRDHLEAQTLITAVGAPTRVMVDVGVAELRTDEAPQTAIERAVIGALRPRGRGLAAS